jgi:hypothetical protein
MPLLNCRHADPKTAALSIAANRASKVRLLRARGHEDLALKSERNLYKDVLTHICHNPYLGESFIAELAGTAVDCEPTPNEIARSSAN